MVDCRAYEKEKENPIKSQRGECNTSPTDGILLCAFHQQT
jgi:hypothetical protein